MSYEMNHILSISTLYDKEKIGGAAIIVDTNSGKRILLSPSAFDTIFFVNNRKTPFMIHGFFSEAETIIFTQ